MRIEFEKCLKTTPAGHKLFVPKRTKTHSAMKRLENFVSDHRKFAKDIDSTRPMTFHGLRHTCAAEWYQKFISEGKSDYEAKVRVSRLLGYERDDVTRIYLASLDIKPSVNNGVQT